MVRPGYKQTEVGVIPEDWEVQTLGQRGLFSKGSGVRKDQADSGSLPCIRYGELYTTHHDIIKRFNSNISLDVAKTAKRLKRGDILFAGSGETKEEIGKCAAFLDDCEAYAGGDIIIYSPWQDDSCFLGYALNQPVAVTQKAAKGQGDAVVHIGGAALSVLKLPLPPLPEQRAIACALSDMDAALAGVLRLIAKKRDLKQAAMQTLLTGQTRLPGFAGEWEVKRLDRICSMKSGEQITVSRIDSHSSFPCYGGNGLRGFTTSYNHDGHFCLVGRQGALCGNVLEVDGQFFASEHAIVVTPNVDTDISWLTLVLDRMALNQYSESSAQPGLSVAKILMLEVLAPPTRAEQTAIAGVFSDMDAEIAALTAQADKTRLLKQAMMQDLLTGRVRLPLPEAADA